MFYVFEGIDGSGKSTQARLFATTLERRGLEVLEVREPGGTPFGEKVRDLLLDPATGDLTAEAEVFLFLAARSQLSELRIRPVLERGGAVVADRYYWSSLAYQGIVGGLGRDRVLDLSLVATRGRQPDLTFLIDVSPEEGLERRSERGTEGEGEDRVESRGLEYQRQVRDAYLELVEAWPERILRIDGRGSPLEVEKRVLAAELAFHERSGGGS